GADHHQVVLLKAAGGAQAPGVVPDVAFEFADDGHVGEGQEGTFPRRVEAVEGVDQPHPGDLDQVVGILPKGGKSPAEADGEVVVVGEELVAQTAVAGDAVHDVEGGDLFVVAGIVGDAGDGRAVVALHGRSR